MNQQSYELIRPYGSEAEIDRLVQWSLGFLADLNTKDLDRIADWFCEETYLWIPPSAPRIGTKRILRMMRVIFEQYRSLHWSVERLYAVNPGTMITEVKTGGGFLDGRTYQNSILTVQVFSAQGKLLRLSDYFKTTSVFGQQPAAASREQAGGEAP